MKKVFFTMMLAIVSSTWNLSKAICMVPTNGIVTMMAPTDEYVTGVIEEVPMPCEQNNDPEYECPQCLTLAIRDNSDDRLFYLTTYQNPTVEAQLDSIMLVVSTLGSGLSATVSGFKYIPGYTTDSNKEYYSILVSSISTNPLRLKSLCDEWNIVDPPFDFFSPYHTYKQRLTTDTIIFGSRYVKLQQDENYLGALRESDDSLIYFVPANSTHVYLLYAWNVQVGDTLRNLWLGGHEEVYQEGGISALVVSDTASSITLEFETQNTGRVATTWIKGIGLSTGPIGWDYLPGMPVDPEPRLLCAYKDGEQVYASELSKKYGCQFNGIINLDESQTDTIPLYIKDGPGTSTVEPVDPNQIVATLVGDMLSIYEYIGAEIGYKVSKASPGNNMPARGKEMADDTFSESVTIQLKERGLYTLELTNPEWGYTIVGTFEYDGIQGIEPVETGVPAAQKILRDGQLLIQKGDRTYTVQGIELHE